MPLKTRKYKPMAATSDTKQLTFSTKIKGKKNENIKSNGVDKMKPD